MNKKKDPRTEFIIVRVSKTEKKRVETEAIESNKDFSDHVRYKLGL